MNKRLLGNSLTLKKKKSQKDDNTSTFHRPLILFPVPHFLAKHGFLTHHFCLHTQRTDVGNSTSTTFYPSTITGILDKQTLFDPFLSALNHNAWDLPEQKQHYQLLFLSNKFLLPNCPSYTGLRYFFLPNLLNYLSDAIRFPPSSLLLQKKLWNKSFFQRPSKTLLTYLTLFQPNTEFINFVIVLEYNNYSL